jgi:hypothetical protein
LRHTAATISLIAGVSPKIAFTLDVYSHVLPHMQDAQRAEKVDALLINPTLH